MAAVLISARCSASTACRPGRRPAAPSLLRREGRLVLTAAESAAPRSGAALRRVAGTSRRPPVAAAASSAAVRCSRRRRSSAPHGGASVRQRRQRATSERGRVERRSSGHGGETRRRARIWFPSRGGHATSRWLCQAVVMDRVAAGSRASPSSAAASPVWQPPSDCSCCDPSCDVTVLEAPPQVGGKLRSARWPARRSTWAPSRSCASPRGVELADAVGLRRRLVHPATSGQASGPAARSGRCRRRGWGSRPTPAAAASGVLSALGLHSAGSGVRAAARRRDRRTSGSARLVPSGSVARSATGWSSRCSAASTPAEPTSCRSLAAVPALVAGDG